jgi:isoleucyl-tRNA synthetase
LVVVIDTELTPELRAEGDARELQRAIQDLRRDAGLALDDRIDVWLEPFPEGLGPHLGAVAVETLATTVEPGRGPSDVAQATVELGGGTVALAIRRAGEGVAG